MKKESLFLLVLSISSLVVASSFSFFVTWVFMEFATFFFVPLILGKSFSFYSIFTAWKYFVIQGVGSFFFFLSVVCDYELFSSFSMSLILVISMVIKLGLFPSISWVFQVSENLDWVSFLFFSTISKFIPLIVLTKSLSDNLSLVVSVLILLSTASSLWLMVENFSTRILLTISSSINLNWLLMASIIDEFLMIFFLTVYSIFLTGIIWFSKKSDSMSESGLVLSSNLKTKVLFFSFFIIFSTGIPPFGIFFTKFELACVFLKENPFLSVLIILFSSLASFLYIKILLPVLLNEAKGLKIVEFFSWGAFGIFWLGVVVSISMI